MEVLSIILAVALLISVGIIAATKSGKFGIKDADNDGIPDLIEKKFEELKSTIEKKIK